MHTLITIPKQTIRTSVQMVGTLSLLLSSGCPICPNDMWADVVFRDSPQCTGIDDNSGQPHLEWVMTRIPVGVPEFEASGVGLDSSDITVWLAAGASPTPGQSKIPVTVERLPGADAVPHWRIKPQWTAATLASGPGRLFLSRQGAELTARPLTLVRVGLAVKGNAALTATVDPTWLYMDKVNAQPTLFIYNRPDVGLTSYVDGEFGTPRTFTMGPSVSPISPDNGTSTGFAVVKTASSTKFVSYNYDGTSYIDKDVTNNVVGRDYKVVTAGLSNDSSKLLWAAVDAPMALRACLWDRKNFLNDCVVVATPGFEPTAMWTLPLRPSMQPDIVLMGPSGLRIYRTDATLQTTTEYRLPQVSGSDVVANAAAFMGGTAGGNTPIDLVETHPGGVVLFHNDGQGTFTPTATAVTNMPPAQSLALGDIDLDGKADLLIKATDGKLWLLLNESDMAAGDGKFSQPVAAMDTSNPSAPVQISLGANGRMTFDGSSAGRLITYTATSQAGTGVLRSWDRQVNVLAN